MLYQEQFPRYSLMVLYGANGMNRYLCFALFALILPLATLTGCNSSDLEVIDDIVDEPNRKTIDASRLGTNAFVNDPSFGSISAQFTEVRDVLDLKFVRVLFAWNNSVQPSPGAPLNFSFYDDIASRIPGGLDAVVVLTGVPGWMSDSANWVGGDPRRTFVEKWVTPVAARYAGNGRIIGYEIWNEPNQLSNQDNTVMGIATSPLNFLSLVSLAFDAIKTVSPGKLVVSGATTAINQNFPDTKNYNSDLIEAGVQNVIDVYGVHVYGKQFERFERNDGVFDTLNDLFKPIWVTESGAQGVNEQLPYGEQMWPYLIDNLPNIQRIYQYQFTENSPSASTYGMKNRTPGAELSDLYIWLRDR